MTDTAARLATALGGRYTIQQPLGAGGMATVYLAHDERHARDVAIKVLHPELAAVLGAERFLSEIKTTARLQHPHILPLLDSGEADGLLFYVMPLITGETLRARLERDRQLPVDEALRYAREVADALGSAHAQGIIHRDIKPENILLQGGHALVADFGIALAVQSAGGERMTQTGMSLGTPQYMSPEQAMGERNIDARSDIYALGAVTYEMLVGEAPFTGPSVQAIIARVMSEDPRGITGQRKAVPPQVEEAVLRALEKLPADRFATAAEFGAALGITGTSTAYRAAPAATGSSSRRLYALAALNVLLATVAVLAALGLFGPRAEPEVIRYRLSVDSITDLRDWTGAIAISPDGRSIVHTSGPNGRLLRRERDAVEFHPIEGSLGAQGPFFSPDGSQVGFFSGGQLLFAPLAGGPPTVLLENLTAPVAASWSDDDFVYFDATGGLGGIQRLRARRGATPEPVTTVRLDSGETHHMLPEPLPGGRAVLFQIARSDGRSAIGVVEVGTGTHRELVDGTRARYLRSGHIVYASGDGKLWALPFDPKSLETSGTPVQVGDRLGQTMVGPVDFAVSHSGTLVYAMAEASDERELVWVARDGVRTPVDSTWRAGFTSPRLSPDNRSVAVVVQGASSSHIWTRALPQGVPRRVTVGNGRYDEPAWTPDGRSITALNSQGTFAVGSVVRLSVGGGSTGDLVLDTDRPFSEHSWSRTGGWLLVRTTTPTPGGGDILAFRPGVDTAARPIRDSPRAEYSPAISPDGRWLAYVSNETGQLETFVIPFPEPGNRKWQVSTQGGMAPAWSPRGDELFFLDLRANLVAASVRSTPEFSAGPPQILFSVSDQATRAVSRRNYDVSADGSRFLMVQRPSGSFSAKLMVVEHLDAELRGAK